MDSKKTKSIKYIDVLASILVFLLLGGCFSFAIENLKVVSETNQNNFKYTVKVRDTIEEMDKIVERAQVNINVLSDVIKETYDINKKNDKDFNFKYLNQIDAGVKSVLINTPGVCGSWFQLDNDLPFADKGYLWYTLDKGKIINYKEKLEKINPERRKLTPKEDPYYFEAIKNKHLVWSEIYTDSDSKIRMLTISEPIYKDGKLIGVTGIDISTKNLQNVLNNMQSVFKQADIFLVDQKGNPLLYQLSEESTHKKLFEKFKTLFKNSKTKEGMVEFDNSGEKITAIKLQLSNKYNIIIVFPTSVIFKGFHNLNKIVYFIFIILAFLTTISIINKYKMLQMHKELKTEKDKLRTIIDNSSNIILLKNLKGVYLECNKTFLKLVNKTREEIIGKNDYEIFPNNQRELQEILKNDKIVETTKEPLYTEDSLILPDGTKIYLEKNLIPLFDHNGKLVNILIICFDITKQKLEQKSLQKIAEEAEKIASIKSNFLANMSHEIRTPLNGVLGFIQLLKETDLTAEQEEFLNDAEKSSEILLSIINDILDFSKIEANKLEIEKISFNIRSLVEDITLFSSATAEKKGLDVHCLICSDVPENVIGAPGRIRQILTNLINNSIKFTNKGEIVVFVKLISETNKNALVSFEVKDTGIGIPEDKLEMIFEEFAQVDSTNIRKYGGTGLGLAISKRLVNLMGGKLEVKSKLAQGTAFTFILPFKKDKKADLKIDKSAEILSGKRILLIDDNKTDLNIIKHYLNESKCIIYAAESFEKGLEILKKKLKDISLIIVDFKLYNTNKNNAEILAKIQDIPIILYTSLSTRGDAIWAKKEGFRGYLTKPIKRKELLETVSLMLNNENEPNEKELITKYIIKEEEFNEKIKILVVEDNFINCKLITKLLMKHDLACDVAYDGQKAIEAFESGKYDLIFMDCQMPVLNGYEATEKIRDLEKGLDTHVPIIALTANALHNDVQKCKDAGMDDYISKPINIDDILKIISKYVAQKQETNDLTITVNSLTKELGLCADDALQLIREYLDILPHNLSELKNAYDENDIEQMKKLAHKMKGTNLNLRIEKLAQLSIDLENALKENQGNESYLRIFEKISEYYEHLNALASQNLLVKK